MSSISYMPKLEHFNFAKSSPVNSLPDSSYIFAIITKYDEDKKSYEYCVEISALMNTLCFVDGCTYEYSFLFTSEYKLEAFIVLIFAMFLFASTSQETCMRLCENLMNVGFAFCININLYLYKISYDMTDAMFLRRTVTSVCVISALGVVKPLYAVALSPSMRDGSAMPELAGKWRKPMTSFVTVQFSTAVSVSAYIAVLYTSVSLFFVFSSLLSTVPYREYKFLFLSLTVMKKASGPKSSIVRSTMTYPPAMRASVFCMFHTMYIPVLSLPPPFAILSPLRSFFSIITF